MRTRIAMLVVLLGAAGAVLAAPAGTPADFKLKPGASGATCLNCHSEFGELLKLPFVHTPVKGGNCADCHSPA